MRDLMSSGERPSLMPMITAVTAAYALEALNLDASGHSLSFSRSVIPMLVVGSRMLLTFLVGPVILAVVGRWLRGQGDAADTLPAVVWSYLPFVVSACIYTPVGLMAVGLQFLPLTESLKSAQWKSPNHWSESLASYGRSTSPGRFGVWVWWS